MTGRKWAHNSSYKGDNPNEQCSKPLLVDDFGVIVQSNMSGLLQSFTIIVLFPLDLGNRFLTNQHNDA